MLNYDFILRELDFITLFMRHEKYLLKIKLAIRDVEHICAWLDGMINHNYNNARALLRIDMIITI